MKFAVFSSLFVASLAHAAPTLTLHVDARDASRRVIHVRESVPVKAGALALFYPKWFPGGHTPSGPIENVVDLRVRAGGKTVPWRRDPVEMHAFLLDVPDGASALDVEFDLLAVGGVGGRQHIVPTEKQVLVDWFDLVLYPRGARASEVMVAPSLELPAGWQWASALDAAKEKPGAIEFKPVSLERLVDSPVLAGAVMRKIALAPPPDGVTHAIAIAAETPAELAAPDDLVAGWGRLVAEAGALFGARHYRRYTFLLSLADAFGRGGGLEHHESSDNRLPDRALVDPFLRKRAAGLLGHEFAHSWNGKYRRPSEIATPDFEQPMQDALLWVYEGLTSYLGDVLTARAGLRTPAETRELLALYAADLDHRAGRAWRPLADTAVAAPITYGAPEEGSSARRPVDFYPEGALLWLEADALIRRESGGKRSLDDFCRRFHGGQGGKAAGEPVLSPYSFEDVVAALDATQPHDWKKFLRDRLDQTGRPAAAALAAAGWTIAWDDTPNEIEDALEKTGKQVILRHTVGLTLAEDGAVVDAIPGMPAAKAGIAPKMRVVAVNGKRFSRDVVRDALKASRGAKAPMQFLVENADYFSTVSVDWRGGDRYPHLARDAAKPDLLEAIWTPLLAAPVKSK